MAYLNEPKTVGIIGAPMALGQDLVGVEDAPKAMRAAGLHQVIKELGWKVEDRNDVEISLPHNPAGEVGQVKNGKVKYALEVGTACHNIAERVEAEARQGRFCLTLGGDHSIAMGSISGVLRARPNTALVWVDAHGDFNTPETSPSGHLHGMPLAALLGQVKSEAMPGFEWLDQTLSPAQVTLIGIRSVDAEERILLRQSGIRIFTMTEIDRFGIGVVMAMALEAINPDGTRPYHLSFDIDALDPYIAPGTGTKARGGLSYREAHYIAEAMAETGLLTSMDLVEINPSLGFLEDRPNAKTESGTTGVEATVELGLELIASALGKRIL